MAGCRSGEGCDVGQYRRRTRAVDGCEIQVYVTSSELFASGSTLTTELSWIDALLTGYLTDTDSS